MARTKDDALHAQRRDDILKAAARVFKTKGFHLARTDHICAEANLSAGTLFRHFPDKSAIISAIALSELESYREGIEQLASREGIEWMAQMDVANLKILLKPTDYDLGADSWLELTRNEENRQTLLSFDKELRRIYTRVLKRGQTEGWIRPTLHCEAATALVLSLLTGLMFERELGFQVESKNTALAIADLFSSFLEQIKS